MSVITQYAVSFDSIAERALQKKRGGNKPMKMNAVQIDFIKNLLEDNCTVSLKAINLIYQSPSLPSTSTSITLVSVSKEFRVLLLSHYQMNYENGESSTLHGF